MQTNIQPDIKNNSVVQDVEAEDRPEIYDQLEQVGDIALMALGYLRQPLGILGIFAISIAIVGLFYFLETRKLDGIEARIDESRSILALAAPDLGQLQLRLDGWEYSRGLALEGRIDRPADSQVLEDLLSAAILAGVDVFSAGARDEGIASVSEGDYRSTPSFVKATGELDEITTFIKLLESGAIRSATVQKSLVSESLGVYSVDVDIASLSEFPYIGIETLPDVDSTPRRATAAVTP